MNWNLQVKVTTLTNPLPVITILSPDATFGGMITSSMVGSGNTDVGVGVGEVVGVDVGSMVVGD